MNKSNRPIVCPGEVVREEIEAHGWTQQQFAEIIGRSRQYVNSLLSGKTALTFDVAFRLEAALGVPAETWLRMESIYRESLDEGGIKALRREVSARAKRADSVAEKRARYRA
jgi:addiction module HigA family antidote